MKNQLYRYLQLLLLFSLPFLLITACNTQVTPKADNPKTKLATSNCRMVVHQLGKTCAPLQSQRIIVTDEIALDAVLGLGLKPVATAEPNSAGSRGRQLKGKIEGVASLGKGSQINIEKMVELNPDLIVGYFMNSQKYQLFSQIAPTVKPELKYLKGTWKDSLLEVASTLNKTEQAEIAITNYQKRIEKLRKAIEQRFGKVEVSVIRFYAGGAVKFNTIFSFASSIFEEVGISAPPQQLPFATNEDRFAVPISLERIDLVDADVLFVMLDPDSEDNFKRYQSSPLWKKLNVVQNKRVYTVDSGYWYLGNILAANAILDDLEKYLLGN